MCLNQSDIICLDHGYATTRKLSAVKPVDYQRIAQSLQNKIHGGLREKGFYKQSYPDKPLISIITAVYNGKNELEETIKSILGQNYDNLEYIIIDGGSEDGTLDVIRRYDEYIDFWISEADAGVYDAMNKGIDFAFGDWLNFINAGDRLLHLDVQSLQQTSSCYCYDQRLGKINRRPLTKTFLCRNTPYHQSIFYKKTDIRYYDLKYSVNADYEQMTRIVGRIGKGGANNSLVYYSEPGISKIDRAEPISTLRARLRMQRSIIKQNLGWPYYFIAAIHSVRIVLRKAFTMLINNVLSRNRQQNPDKK
jgi:glycosyltransferase involved in cell wall biosynthesis